MHTPLHPPTSHLPHAQPAFPKPASRRRWLKLGLGLGGAALGLHAQAAPALRVLASTELIADWLRWVGGARVQVRSLVPAGADPHSFAARPADVLALVQAERVFALGLGYEPWLDRLLNAAHAQGKTSFIGPAAAPLRQIPGAPGATPVIDPHVWMDPLRLQRLLAQIAKTLSDADPAGADSYQKRSAAGQAQLAELNAWAQAALADLPLAQRRLVSQHDALGYLAERYALHIVAAQSVGGHTQASAQHIAALVRQVQQAQVRAVFLENSGDPRLIEALAREARVRVGGTLYVDVLSPPDGPAPDTLHLLRHDLRSLVQALSGAPAG